MAPFQGEDDPFGRPREDTVWTSIARRTANLDPLLGTSHGSDEYRYLIHREIMYLSASSGRSYSLAVVLSADVCYCTRYPLTKGEAADEYHIKLW